MAVCRSWQKSLFVEGSGIFTFYSVVCTFVLTVSRLLVALVKDIFDVDAACR